MGCCDDSTEPVKINRTDVARIQEQYGTLSISKLKVISANVR